MEIREQGQVFRLTLPDNWVEIPQEVDMGGVGTRSLRQFSPAGNAAVQFCFFYRGLPVREASALAFKQTLAAAPHRLGQDEIDALGGILGERTDPHVFNLMAAKTEALNGRVVLTIAGRYRLAQTDMEEILIDAGGDGRVVQEVYFIAPKDEFIKYARIARSAFKSIIWAAHPGRRGL